MNLKIFESREVLSPRLPVTDISGEYLYSCRELPW